MTGPQITPLPSASNVSAGATATIDLPRGLPTYLGVLLDYGTSTAGGPTEANIEAELTELRVNVNGVTQVKMTSAELFTLNALYGRPYSGSDGVFYLPFSYPHMRSTGGEDALAWGTADVDSLQIEVDIDAGATSPTLKAYGVTLPIRQRMGPIRKVRRQTIPVAATGTVNVSTLPKSDAYLALHAFSANISDVAILVDRREVYRVEDEHLSYAAKALGGGPAGPLVPQTSVVHILPWIRGRVAEALAMVHPDGRPVGDFQVDFTMTSAASFVLLTEVLGLRDG